jgi:hypothetical protein
MTRGLTALIALSLSLQASVVFRFINVSNTIKLLAFSNSYLRLVLDSWNLEKCLLTTEAVKLAKRLEHTRHDPSILSDTVKEQLRQYAETTASLFQEHAFHSLEHSAHGLLSPEAIDASLDLYE